MAQHVPQSTVDVLIVGAGPTGLTLACELVRRGVSCQIIDQAEAPATTSRALGVHSRTLEVFQNMGIVEQVLAEGSGVRAFGVQLYEGDTPIVSLMLLSEELAKWKGVPYPFVLIIPQSTAEHVLREHLHELGGRVEYAKALMDVRQEQEIVRMTTGHPDSSDGGIEEIRAHWVVGCDGAHSQVRRALGIPFEGRTYPETLLLADVDMDWGRERDRSHSWLHRNGLLAAFPLPGGGNSGVCSPISPRWPGREGRRR